MNYDEFYKGNEYKGSNEHIILKLEITPNKEVILLDEIKKVKEDNVKLRKDEPTEKGTYKKNNDTNESTKDLNTSSGTNISTQTATNSLVSTTSAVTAGAIAVAAISIAVAAPPIVELLSFKVGGDYLSYSIETNELVDGISYYIEIDDKNDFHYKKEITSPGIFEETVNNLVPNTYYTYKFVGYDSVNDSKVYLDEEFTTSFDYLATYNKYNFEEITIKWTYLYNEETQLYDEIYRIIIPTKFNNETDKNYEYRVTLSNNEGLNEVYQGVASEVVFDIPRTYTNATLKYESIIIENDEEIICDTFITDNYIFKESFTISDIYLDYQNNNLIVESSLNAPETYGIKYYTSLNSEPVDFYASNTSFLEFPTEEITYYFYMVDEEGNIVSETKEYTINLIEKVPFEFEYLNPSSITITYNNNGSLNAYMDTKFQSDDKDIYYEIHLVDYEYSTIKYKSQNRYASIENFVEHTGKGVTFMVYKEINGIKHCFHYTTPSGTLDTINGNYNFSSSIDTSVSPAVFTFGSYNGFKLDTSSAYLMIDDTRIDIPSELFLLDEYGDYTLTMELPELENEITNAQLHLMGSGFFNNFSTLKEIPELDMKGSCYTKLIYDL